MVEFLYQQPFLLFGFLLTIAYFLNILLSRYNLPHILFYLVTGFLAGNFLFVEEVKDLAVSEWFKIIEILALGLIGFLIGTELHIKEMAKEKKLITVLLIANVFGGFILTYILVMFYTQNMLLSLLMAALATSVSPATTIGVIKSLRAKGPLTQRVQWLLAFDDVITVTVVEALLIIVVIILGGDQSFGSFFPQFGQKIGFAILLGLVIGYLLNFIVERMHDTLEMMEFTLAVVIFVIGLAVYVDTSIISSTMVLGAIVTNTGGDNYKDAHDLIDIFMSPILALFFITIGTKVQFSDLYNPFPWIALLYFVGRAIGKIYGTYFGAKALGIEEPMRSGIGYSIVAQGSVVVGLAILANELLISLGRTELGNIILSQIVIATLISEFIGSVTTDWAIKKNNEDGKADMSINKNPEPNSKETTSTDT